MLERFPSAYFLARVLTSNVTRLGHPFKISWAVTYRCNLACRMCNIWKRQDAEPELTVEDADRFFRRAGKFSWVGMTGGEPFLRPDLDALADVVARRVRPLKALHINTNGQLGDRVAGFAEGFRSRHPKIKLIVTVSVDGPPEVHDAIRGRPGAWRKAADTFAGLKRIAGVKAQVGFTLSGDNFGSYEATLAALAEAVPALAPDDVNVNVFQTSGVYYDNREMESPSPKALSREVDRILAADRGGLTLNSRLRRSYLRYYKDFLATGKAPLTCQAFSSSCFLDPFGNLYPCIMYDRKFLNVRELDTGLETAWASPEGRKIRGECARQECPSCWTPCDAFSAIAGSLHRSLA